jgi:hypothetical protein
MGISWREQMPRIWHPSRLSTLLAGRITQAEHLPPGIVTLPLANTDKSKIGMAPGDVLPDNYHLNR